MVIDASQQQEMLDLKKIESFRELLVRLQKELKQYEGLTVALAAGSSHNFMLSQSNGEVETKDPIDLGALGLVRAKVFGALRQSVYRCSQQIKTFDQQGRAIEAELEEEMQEA
jgi:hypothetical protein